MRRFLTLDEVSEMYGVPVSTLYAQRSRGESPGILGIRIGRYVRFDPVVLDAWAEAQRGSGAPQGAGTVVSIRPTPARKQARHA